MRRYGRQGIEGERFWLGTVFCPAVDRKKVEGDTEGCEGVAFGVVVYCNFVGDPEGHVMGK